MINQSLSQKFIQKMTPHQIQLMKLLQIPTFALDQRIKEEMEINPALEFNEDSNSKNEEDLMTHSEENTSTNEVDFEEYFPEYTQDDNDFWTPSDGFSQDSQQNKFQIPDLSNDLVAYLEQQFEHLELTNQIDRLIGFQIIGSLDDDGYLRRETSSITDDLLFQNGLEVSENQVDKILKLIQFFDPIGIASRTLQESLLIQLGYKIDNYVELDEFYLQDMKLAKRILDDYFEEFSKKHFSKLSKSLEVSDDDLKAAFDIITSLNPRPASGYSSNADVQNLYIEPDFTIQNKDGILELSLNSRNAPELKVGESYKHMIRNFKLTRSERKLTKSEKETAIFVKQKIESAKIFIESIQKRHKTLYDTMEAIMHKQYDFFLTGDVNQIKPMILKDIANIVGVDISTISRVANSKYVQTEFGTKLIKEFFSESIQNVGGEEISTIEIKNNLEQLIKIEDKSNPYSDEKLTELLAEKGYILSRRTVSKYREKLNIQVARLRKEFI